MDVDDTVTPPPRILYLHSYPAFYKCWPPDEKKSSSSSSFTQPHAPAIKIKKQPRLSPIKSDLLPQAGWIRSDSGVPPGAFWTVAGIPMHRDTPLSYARKTFTVSTAMVRTLSHWLDQVGFSRIRPCWRSARTCSGGLRPPKQRRLAVDCPDPCSIRVCPSGSQSVARFNLA